MIREDPYTRQQRHQIASQSLMVGMLTLLTIIQFANPHNDLPSRLFLLIPECLLLILVGVIVVRGQARFKHLTQLRENVLRGNSALLAEKQPSPDANALPVPTTIEFNRFRSSRIAFIIGLAFALFIIFVLAIVFSAANSNKQPAIPQHPSNDTIALIFLGVFIVALILIVVILVLFFWQVRKQMIYRIIVYEEGLSSTYQGITSSIRWSDARLFTITSPDKLGVLRVYELANAATIVHWVNLPTRLSLFDWSINDAASSEYRSNVETLLSVIAARTGLPLYDFNATLKAQKEGFIS